ncbi:MAG: efflux RND transporter periplasmic adaptor subunit [Anaerolineaceae bacterium]
MRKWIVWIIVLGLIGAGGYYLWQRVQQNRAEAAMNFETVELQRGELVAYVGTTGTVRANQSASLVWQISGRIGEVYARVGDPVEADFVLAALAPDSLPQSLIQARADLITAQRDLDNLLTSTVAQAEAQLALANAEDALEEAQHKMDSKQYQRASDATVDSARANYILAQDAVKTAEKAYNRFADLDEDNILRAQTLASLSAARQQRDTALANLNWLLGRPDDIELSQAQANLSVAQANYDAALREWDRLKDGPDPDDVTAAEVRIEAIQNTINSSVLKAPFAGTVTEINALKGDLVDPAVVSFRIDDLSRLIVDVQVPEVDINQVQPGQLARITFDAIKDRTYTGQVVEVARVGTTSQSGVDFKVSFVLQDADDQVRPGMTAAVNIIVNQLEDVLLVPNRAVRLRESSRVVYVMRNGVLTMIEIQLGAVGDVYSEVAAGAVEEGDLIVLNPPTEEQMQMFSRPNMRN